MIWGIDTIMAFVVDAMQRLLSYRSQNRREAPNE